MESKKTIPRGVRFAGVASGVKASGEKDFALVATDNDCVAVGAYTQNLVHAASIDWNRDITPSNRIRAIAINSGNANACTGQQGIDNNRTIAELVASEIGATSVQVLVLSTGIIGQHLAMDKIAGGIKKASQELSANPVAFESASDAILTSDNGPKRIRREVEIKGESVSIAAMAKGAGMIGPRMATMLSIITTDAKLDSKQAQRMLSDAVNLSFNRISVEGHTSTNDAVVLLCTGNSIVDLTDDENCKSFSTELNSICLELAKMIPSDGEGATHLVEISVAGAKDDSQADRIARTVAQSNLVKTAITGNDPNWGRIVSAVGYCPAIEVDPSAIELKLNGHLLYQNGTPVGIDEKKVSESMAASFETKIELSVGEGQGDAIHWTSDLTKEYVRFNSEYTT